MSKVSFRARALDASRPMPVYDAYSLPDPSECSNVNRTVPQMPTGMEKEEEKELHLQQAISAQQALSTGTESADVIIPVPDVREDTKIYSNVYGANRFVLPKQYIKIQAALNVEPELPDYDMDSEDESWVEQQSERLELDGDKFEKMMDRLEKQSEHQVINLDEAKTLLQEDDDLTIAVYDYWLAKRLRMKHPLIATVKTERRDGSTSTHPYVAFRRRTEKIQTRKNRKNDEDSYEKMLKIRRDLSKAVTLLEMVKRREKSKRETTNLTFEIFERRYLLEDWDDRIFSQIKADAKPSFQFSREEIQCVTTKQKRENRKKKLSTANNNANSNVVQQQHIVDHEWLLKNAEDWHKPSLFPGSSLKAGLEGAFLQGSVKQLEKDGLDEDVHGPFAFRRKKGCVYHHAFTDSHQQPSKWPWEQSQSPFGYAPAYLHSRFKVNERDSDLQYVGPARRRKGRGGRVIFDRVAIGADLKGFDDPMSLKSSQLVPYFRPACPISVNSMIAVTDPLRETKQFIRSKLDIDRLSRKMGIMRTKAQKSNSISQLITYSDSSLDGTQGTSYDSGVVAAAVRQPNLPITDDKSTLFNALLVTPQGSHKTNGFVAASLPVDLHVKKRASGLQQWIQKQQLALSNQAPPDQTTTPPRFELAVIVPAQANQVLSALMTHRKYLQLLKFLKTSTDTTTNTAVSSKPQSTSNRAPPQTSKIIIGADGYSRTGLSAVAASISGPMFGHRNGFGNLVGLSTIPREMLVPVPSSGASIGYNIPPIHVKKEDSNNLKPVAKRNTTPTSSDACSSVYRSQPGGSATGAIVDPALSMAGVSTTVNQPGSNIMCQPVVIDQPDSPSEVTVIESSSTRGVPGAVDLAAVSVNLFNGRRSVKPYFSGPADVVLAEKAPLSDLKKVERLSDRIVESGDGFSCAELVTLLSGGATKPSLITVGAGNTAGGQYRRRTAMVPAMRKRKHDGHLHDRQRCRERSVSGSSASSSNATYISELEISQVCSTETIDFQSKRSRHTITSTPLLIPSSISVRPLVNTIDHRLATPSPSPGTPLGQGDVMPGLTTSLKSGFAPKLLQQRPQGLHKISFAQSAPLEPQPCAPVGSPASAVASTSGCNNNGSILRTTSAASTGCSNNNFVGAKANHGPVSSPMVVIRSSTSPPGLQLDVGNASNPEFHKSAVVVTNGDVVNKVESAKLAAAPSSVVVHASGVT